ncbi:MAG: hypothetical protein RLZZ387_3548 [Chloroflexota bacterium]
MHDRAGAGDDLAAVFPDSHWADEVLHAQIGRRWLVSELGDMERMRMASEAATANWAMALEELRPLSAQQEWWPTFFDDLRARRAASQSALA